jgi:hypothetical protein
MIIELDELTVQNSIKCGKDRASSYKPQYDGATTKKNYALERYKQSFIDFTERQIDAVGAECAVAQYFGLNEYRPQNGMYKNSADVGQNIEVKHSYRLDGNLIITDLDRDGDVAILVIGQCPVFDLIGYMWVADCKNSKYLHHNITGYLVPRPLRPLTNLALREDKAYELVNPL